MAAVCIAIALGLGSTSALSGAERREVAPSTEAIEEARVLPNAPGQTKPADASSTDEVVVLDDIEVVGRRGDTGILPEFEYDADLIDSQAASSIGEVMDRARDTFSPDEAPVIIINGMRVADPSIYYALPPDALSRLEVLPPGSAAGFGGTASGRVLNLVTVPRFVGKDGEFMGRAPTSGGFTQARVELSRAQMNGRDLVNLNLGLDSSSALNASDRPDYLVVHPESTATTLRPETRNLTVRSSIAKGHGDWFSSLNFDGRRGSNLIFARGIDDAVRLRSRNTTLRLDGGLTGTVSGWNVRLSLSGGLDRSAMSGLQTSTVHVRNLSGGFDLDRSTPGLPAGPIRVSLSGSMSNVASQIESEGARRRFSQMSHIVRGQLSIPLLTSASGVDNASDGTGRRWPAPLGGLDLSLGGSFQGGEDAGGNSSDIGLSWAPWRLLRVNGAWAHNETAPSDRDRFAPIAFGAPIIVYDFRREESIEVLPLTGGNPDLQASRSDVKQINAALGPFTKLRLLATVGLSRSEAHDAPGTLAPTLENEAAFPERFVRDQAGRLIQVDQRSFNLRSSRIDRMTSRLSLTRPSGIGARALSLSLNHSWLLADQTEPGGGLPEQDRLSGDGGGVSPQTLTFQANGRRGPWGLDVSARWAAPYRIRRTSRVDDGADLKIAGFGALDFRLNYAFLGAVSAGADGTPARRGAAASLVFAVDNLFDTRPKAQLADGRPAPGYGRSERDPVGRTVSLTLRRRF
ncbi:hypothetical protein GCM10017620_30080 [Brevundimonas intermedia]|uniref:TonB-dependent receptor n=1 Tax=Brevundimonas intermedia TaxID=74315 RepID=A0ABQ5TB43_9CAUL|nr:hypothetical protein [Brevundimonas intermedia]GLK50034.1 hypothetical protein GCM10017620_30080 [Brevundimonas intermedia]